MFPVDQNHIDSEHNNGGYSSLDSELMNLRPSGGQTLLNANKLQQQQLTKSPAVTVDTKQNHITQSNSNAKKSVMLNLKSGAINSTVEEFGNFSTRFSDTFTTNGRRNRIWLIAIAITIGCLCCFAFGLSFNHLFDTQPCGGKCFFHANFFVLSYCEFSTPSPNEWMLTCEWVSASEWVSKCFCTHGTRMFSVNVC